MLDPNDPDFFKYFIDDAGTPTPVSFLDYKYYSILSEISQKLDTIIHLLKISNMGEPQNASDQSDDVQSANKVVGGKKIHSSQPSIKSNVRVPSKVDPQQLLKEKRTLEDDIKIYQRLYATIKSSEYLEKIEKMQSRIDEIDRILK